MEEKWTQFIVKQSEGMSGEVVARIVSTVSSTVRSGPRGSGIVRVSSHWRNGSVTPVGSTRRTAASGVA